MMPLFAISAGIVVAALYLPIDTDPGFGRLCRYRDSYDWLRDRLASREMDI